MVHRSGWSPSTHKQNGLEFYSVNKFVSYFRFFQVTMYMLYKGFTDFCYRENTQRKYQCLERNSNIAQKIGNMINNPVHLEEQSTANMYLKSQGFVLTFRNRELLKR